MSETPSPADVNRRARKAMASIREWAFLRPEERVFGTLRNLRRIVKKAPDLNAERDLLLHMIERARSWEGQFFSSE